MSTYKIEINNSDTPYNGGNYTIKAGTFVYEGMGSGRFYGVDFTKPVSCDAEKAKQIANENGLKFTYVNPY